MNKEELFKLREKLEEEERNKGTEEEKTIKIIIEVFKKYNDREPTDEEIQRDLDFLEGCKNRRVYKGKEINAK